MRPVYIDPPSKAFYQNRFFKKSELNRDDCLRPYIRLKEELGERGIEVNTFDLWDGASPMDYYSFGMLDNLETMHANSKVKMKAFYVFEPPIVDPAIYKALPKLTAMFEKVYLHNAHGDGYDLKGVDQSKLKKLFWPQPFNHVLEAFWSNTDRKKKIVVINGNHKPASLRNELYSKRIEAMAALSKFDMVDLYGRGWERWYSRASMWMPYWKNKKVLMSIYKGACESKYEVLSQYEFCLCFENMVMDGYMTEKLFDCLYAGCIPIYYGASDVFNYVDSGMYIDATKFAGWGELLKFIASLSEVDIKSMRLKGKEFLVGGEMDVFYTSLLHICEKKEC